MPAVTTIRKQRYLARLLPDHGFQPEAADDGAAMLSPNTVARRYRSIRFCVSVATLSLDHMSGAGAIIGLGASAVPQGRADGCRRRSRGVLE